MASLFSRLLPSLLTLSLLACASGSAGGLEDPVVQAGAGGTAQAGQNAGGSQNSAGTTSGGAGGLAPINKGGAGSGGAASSPSGGASTGGKGGSPSAGSGGASAAGKGGSNAFGGGGEAGTSASAGSGSAGDPFGGGGASSGNACCGDTCNDPSIMNCVCSIDFFCCDTWDSICGEEVAEFGCGTCSGSGTGGGSGTDTDCSTKGAGCGDCCQTNHSAGYDAFGKDVVACACEGACSSKCQAACGGGDVSDACASCIDSNLASGTCPTPACDKTSDCNDYLTCRQSCP